MPINMDGICKSHGYIPSSDCQCQDQKAKKGGCNINFDIKLFL